MSFSIFGQVLPVGSGTGGPDTLDLGIQFQITQSGYQLSGYYFSVPPGGDTTGSDYSFRLYSTVDAVNGVLITGSTITGSGTFTAGSWASILLPSPPALISGTTYIAVVTLGNASVGFYSSLLHFWDTGAGSGGITSGPITAPGAAAAIANSQQPFNEPATGGVPVTEFRNSFYGIDINVTATQTPPPVAPGMLFRRPAVIVSNSGWQHAGHSY